MYETHFGWIGRPFPSVLQLENYHPAATIDAARQVLVRCIHRAEGVGIVVGPSGTGKSLLCQILVAHFADTFQTTLLSTGQLGSRRAVLQAILHGLKQPYRGMDTGELRLALTDYLTASPKCPNGILLLIDEAHLLPTRLLDELRLVTNLVVRGQPRARLILAGDASLEERLGDPKLSSFSQRIVARCYLEPFNRCETEAYIHRQIERVGGQGELVFPPETCHAVFQASDGIPRLINQVCDHALMRAYGNGAREVDAASIQEAWAELQQLPSPWSGRTQDSSRTVATIEFGGLDDEPEASLPAISAGAAVDHAANEAIYAVQDPGEARSAGLVAWRPDEDAFDADNLDADEIDADNLEATAPEDVADLPAELGPPHDAPPTPAAATAPNDAPPAELPGAIPAPDISPMPPVPSEASTFQRICPRVDVAVEAMSGCSTVFCDAYGLFGGEFREEEFVWDPTAVDSRIRNAVATTREPLGAEETRTGEGVPVLPLRQHGNAAALAGDDGALVIEDDGLAADADRSEPPPRVVPVRSHQYGQLFARLRRSEYGT